MRHLPILVAVITGGLPIAASAQDQAEEQIGEVVVTGTRRAGVLPTETLSPVLSPLPSLPSWIRKRVSAPFPIFNTDFTLAVPSMIPVNNWYQTLPAVNI